MNKLNRFQRKMVYLIGMIVLFIPIIYLGLPSGGADKQSGGTLAQMRVKNRLSESTFGKIDPASSTMNLVLLGLRGPATCVLWIQAQDQQMKKEFASLRTTVDSIILLQPHFREAWKFQSWNLAYNVSAEWDLVADRFYWVKEGLKFLKRGIGQNERYPELYWHTGNLTGNKIGRSDEWRQFRKFFKIDPDSEQYNGGPDSEINPDSRDNYLEAREWFRKSDDRNVDALAGEEQHVMALPLFRSYPMRALMEYATTIGKEGVFDEVGRNAWETAFTEWTRTYGLQEYSTPKGFSIHMEISPAESKKLIEDRDQDRIEWINRYRAMCNYLYWRTWTQCQSERNSMEAHRDLYDGQQAFANADFSKAKELLLAGMEKYERMLFQYPELLSRIESVEDALIAVLFYHDTLLLLGEELPEEYPLKALYDNAVGEVLDEVKVEFKRRKQNANR